VILLTDGIDSTGKPIGPYLTRIDRSGVTVNAIAFKPNSTVNAQSLAASAGQLQRLARAGKGGVRTATEATTLAGAFRQVAQEVGDQLLVTAKVPSALAGHLVDVDVTARTGSDTVTGHATVLLGAAPAARVPTVVTGPRPVAVTTGPLADRRTLYAGVAVMFLGLLAVVWLLAATASRDRAEIRVRRRLSLYTLTGRAAEERIRTTTVLGDSALARSAVALAGRMVSRRGVAHRLGRRLERSGVPLKPPEWALLHAAAAVGLPLLLLLLTAGNIAAALLGLLVGLAAPWAYLVVQEGRRTAAFLAQLPDTLQLLAGSLSAGYSFPQAVDSVVREGQLPIAGEFNKALVESRLGVPLEDALESVAGRMGSRDFAWVVMAVRIQREVGGNLAEVLTTVAGTLRERDRLRRQAQTLSAEGRLSAYILFALPLVFAGYLLIVRRSYIGVLFTDPRGVVLLAIGGVLLAVGAVWLRKVVRVEV
jgi:tight adherence protein B